MQVTTWSRKTSRFIWLIVWITSSSVKQTDKALNVNSSIQQGQYIVQGVDTLFIIKYLEARYCVAAYLFRTNLWSCRYLGRLHKQSL